MSDEPINEFPALVNLSLLGLFFLYIQYMYILYLALRTNHLGHVIRCVEFHLNADKNRALSFKADILFSRNFEHLRQR